MAEMIGKGIKVYLFASILSVLIKPRIINNANPAKTPRTGPRIQFQKTIIFPHQV